jgi:vitamin B12 transporter
MTQNGGAGQTSSMFIRGMDSKRTLVLIDGVRYNDVTGLSGAQFSQIMLYNVEQIEIVKGAQSGVWGADASAGVINIVTTKAKKGLHAQANIEYGSFDTKTASLQASYATDTYDITMGGSYFDTDGFSAAEPTKSSPEYGKRYDDLGWEKDVYTNKAFNAKAGWNITDKDRVQASIQTINSYTEYDAYAGQDAQNTDTFFGTTSNYYNYLKNRFYSLSYNHKGSVNDIKLAYNLSTFDRSQYGSYTGSVNELKLDDKITYMENGFVRVGGSYQKFEQTKSGGTDLNKNYNAISGFISNYNKFKLISDLDTILTEAIRYDQYNEFDNKATGKLGLKQYIYQDYFVSTNLGTGYNVPTLYQLYAPSFTYFGTVSPVGNDSLQPEETQSIDLTLGNETFWVTGYYNKVKNLIDYVTDPITYAGQYQNLSGNSVLKGVEIGYKDYFFDILGVSANYTYLNAKNSDSQVLARRPKDQVDASVVYYATENFDLGLNGQYVGERYDKTDKQGAQTGKYTVVNFVSNVKVNKYITVYGKVDNITDRYYQTVDGYATAGRSLYLGLNAKY